MLKRLLATAPLTSARSRAIRALGAVAAVVVATHGLARFLLTDHKGSGQWIYLGLSGLIAVAIVAVTRRREDARAPASRRRP